MSDYFIGEIRAFSFAWAPRGWALCDGSQMLITQNAALYSLLGITYGGDGRTNFKLPDLRGRVMVGAGVSRLGTSYVQGVNGQGGSENVALLDTNLPTHNHAVQGCSDTTLPSPGLQNNFLASVKDIVAPVSSHPTYSTALPNTTLIAGTVQPNGPGPSAGHNNMQPFVVLNFCISTTGLYPSRQ